MKIEFEFMTNYGFTRRVQFTVHHVNYGLSLGYFWCLGGAACFSATAPKKLLPHFRASSRPLWSRATRVFEYYQTACSFRIHRLPQQLWLTKVFSTFDCFEVQELFGARRPQETKSPLKKGGGYSPVELGTRPHLVRTNSVVIILVNRISFTQFQIWG